MTTTDSTGTAAPDTYAAVVNDEGQYALWPAWRPLPAGWHDTGVHGEREACLDHIEREWADMRPRGLPQAPQRPGA